MKKFVALVLTCVVASPASPSAPSTSPSVPRSASLASPAATAIANPILFVTQVPKPEDFTTITSTFGNHSARIDSVPRGGDLWIRYPDGTLKNLTRAAGFGMEGLQGASAIAVRDPSVHWSGTKALFSMVVGAAPQQYQWPDSIWQIYEITGLGLNDTTVIRKRGWRREGVLRRLRGSE